MKKFIFLLFLIPVIVYGWVPASYTKTVGFGPGFAPMQRWALQSVTPPHSGEPWEGITSLVRSFEKGGYASGAVLSDAIWIDTVAGLNATQSTEANKPAKSASGTPLFTNGMSYLVFPTVIGSQSIVMRFRTTDTTGDTRLHGFWRSGTDGFVSYFYDNSGLGYPLKLFVSGSFFDTAVDVTRASFANKWTTYILTASGPDTNLDLKSDTEALRSGAFVNSAVSPQRWEVGAIGAHKYNDVVFANFGGEIRLFQIYQPALTPTQRTQLLTNLEGY